MTGTGQFAIRARLGNSEAGGIILADETDLRFHGTGLFDQGLFAQVGGLRSLIRLATGEQPLGIGRRRDSTQFPGELLLVGGGGLLGCRDAVDLEFGSVRGRGRDGAIVAML